MTTNTALKIRKGSMWRAQIEDTPGTFAKKLEPFAKAGQNLQVVAGWSTASAAQKGVAYMEIFPVTDETGKQCAKEAGLHEVTDSVCLIVEGDDRAGLGYAMAKAVADAGVNVRFAMCQSIGKQFQGCFGFHSDAEAQKAQAVLSKI
jgi:hypothetical protein